MKTTIDTELLEKLIETLNFYGEGKNYEWEGCHCHGYYVQYEHGERADECIEDLEALKPRCKCCGVHLKDDACQNDCCEEFYKGLGETV